MDFIQSENVRAEGNHGTKARVYRIGPGEVEAENMTKMKRRGSKEEIGGKGAPPQSTIQVIEE
jgi:NADP-dependent 3-hydroxy acid dehydrogenase YdfG